MEFISRSRVEALNVSNADFIAALEAAFAASRDQRIVGRPKSTINQPDGAFLIGALACWPERQLGIFHNIMGVSPDQAAPAAPHYSTVQLLSDYGTGLPLALIDGTYTSTMLPACITALAAKRLALPRSRIVTFVGAGTQARVNLAALLEDFPIEEVRILTRTSRSANAFAGEVGAQGLKARVFEDPAEAVRDANIVVSTVPSAPDLRPFLSPDRVSEGAFVSAVDVGRSWMPGFEAFDRVITDDRAQAVVQRSEGRLAYEGRFDLELPELLADERLGRRAESDRIVLIHPGNIVGVLGMTALIYNRHLMEQGRN